MKITNGKDFWAGAMFIAFGLAFMIVAQNYAMGNAVRMGPAYFPTVLGGILAVLGAVVLLRAFVSKIEHPLRVFPFRLWYIPIGVGLGVLAFYTQPSRDAGIALLGALGLYFPPVLALIFLEAGLGGVLVFFAGGYKWPQIPAAQVTVFSFALAVFSVASFVHGLGLPMNVWPSLFE